jgi:hypothetical protein
MTVQDDGCELEAYRAGIVHDLRLCGEWHRFIPRAGVRRRCADQALTGVLPRSARRATSSPTLARARSSLADHGWPQLRRTKFP